MAYKKELMGMGIDVGKYQSALSRKRPSAAGGMGSVGSSMGTKKRSAIKRPGLGASPAKKPSVQKWVSTKKTPTRGSVMKGLAGAKAKGFNRW